MARKNKRRSTSDVAVKAAVDTAKVGVVGMAGTAAVGALSPLAGGHGSGVVGAVGTGARLATLGAALGGLAQVGKSVAKDVSPKKKKKSNDIVSKIWG